MKVINNIDNFRIFYMFKESKFIYFVISIATIYLKINVTHLDDVVFVKVWLAKSITDILELYY
jgi:hypothetical protein